MENLALNKKFKQIDLFDFIKFVLKEILLLSSAPVGPVIFMYSMLIAHAIFFIHVGLLGQHG